MRLPQAAISGTVYALGDYTAQAYEGRSWKDFDTSRILRSGLIGFLAHGPLSHIFYEKLDRFFIVSKVCRRQFLLYVQSLLKLGKTLRDFTFHEPGEFIKICRQDCWLLASKTEGSNNVISMSSSRMPMHVADKQVCAVL